MSMPTFAMTYVVWDPRSWTLKVGRAWRFSRVQRWIDLGWVVVVCQRGTDASWERATGLDRYGLCSKTTEDHKNWRAGVRADIKTGARA